MRRSQTCGVYVMHPLDTVMACGKPVLTLSYVEHLMNEGVVVKIRRVKAGVIVDSFFGRIFIAQANQHVSKHGRVFAMSKRLLKTLSEKRVEKVVILCDGYGWAAPLSKWLIEGEDVEGGYKRLSIEVMDAVPVDRHGQSSIVISD